MGFIVTNMSAGPEGVVHFYNGRGTAEQWIKEGKYALNWTRLSCHRFVANQVRLALFILAYNLGNLLRRLCLGKEIYERETLPQVEPTTSVSTSPSTLRQGTGASPTPPASPWSVCERSAPTRLTSCVSGSATGRSAASGPGPAEDRVIQGAVNGTYDAVADSMQGLRCRPKTLRTSWTPAT